MPHLHPSVHATPTHDAHRAPSIHRLYISNNDYAVVVRVRSGQHSRGVVDGDRHPGDAETRTGLASLGVIAPVSVLQVGVDRGTVQLRPSVMPRGGNDGRVESMCTRASSSNGLGWPFSLMAAASGGLG